MLDQPTPVAARWAAAPAVPSWRRWARRPQGLAVAIVILGTAMGWLYLGAMVAAMLPAMDMSALGPGMGVFNAFNRFADLSPEVRAALAALCLPTGAHFGMPGTGPWGLWDITLVFVMWCAMALAMMLPTAGPMLAAHADAADRAAPGQSSALPVLAIAAGYLTVWIGFALVATLAQWALTAVQSLSAAMAPASLILAGSTLIGAGLYQFTPAKLGCLARCRAPVRDLDASLLRQGLAAYRLGLDQGRDCFGCCWALMTVMFAVGVMNVVWILVIGIAMLIEKTTTSPWTARLIGVALVAWGAALVLASPVGARVSAALGLG